MIIIYTPDFSGFHEIANAEAVQMSYYYNDIGKLILDVPINADNAKALNDDCILYDTVKKLSYIIKNVKTDTKQNRITANGFTTNRILNERVIAASVALSNVEGGVYSAVNGNLRGLSRVATAANKGLSERTNIKLYEDDAFTEINSPGQAVTDVGALMKQVEKLADSCDMLIMSGSIPPGVDKSIYADIIRVAIL